MEETQSYKKNIAKNGFYSLIQYALNTILVFLIRYILIIKIGDEYVGLEGLFNNLFGILMISEGGFASILNYRLYSAISLKDNNKISVLLSIYKKLCIFLCVFIFSSGVVFLPFLDFIIEDNPINWNLTYKVYLIQLLIVSLNYIFNYRRALFVADQKNYRLIKIDIAISMLMNLSKLLMLVLLKSYLAYCIVPLVINFIFFVLIKRKFRNNYSFVKFEKVTNKQIREMGIFNEFSNTFITNIAAIIYGSTDNLLITKMFGITTTALYSNYVLVINGVNTILDKALSGFSSSIGNMINEIGEKSFKNVFNNLNSLFYFLATFVGISFLSMFQIFIKVWIGEKFLLSIWFVILLSVNQYLSYCHRAIVLIRGSVGGPNIDKPHNVISAILNILISVVFGLKFGVAGIMFGTVVAHAAIWIGRVKVVNFYFPDLLKSNYWFYEFVKLFLYLLIGFISYKVSIVLNACLSSLFIMVLINIILVVTIVICYSQISENGKIFLKYVLKMVGVIK